MLLNFPHQYLGSIYLEANNKQLADTEEIHQANLENLEGSARIRLQLFNSQTFGGVTIASITLFPFDCSLSSQIQEHQGSGRSERDSKSGDDDIISRNANTEARAVLRRSLSSNTTRLCWIPWTK